MVNSINSAAASQAVAAPQTQTSATAPKLGSVKASEGSERVESSQAPDSALKGASAAREDTTRVTLGQQTEPSLNTAKRNATPVQQYQAVSALG